jgi:hypothetical protein
MYRGNPCLFVDRTLELVNKIRPLLLNPRESDPFWACYTENTELARKLYERHPTLTVYTVTCWGRENWVHRGLRTVNRMGYLFGSEDLGEDYAMMLWLDEDSLE